MQVQFQRLHSRCPHTRFSNNHPKVHHCQRKAPHRACTPVKHQELHHYQDEASTSGRGDVVAILRSRGLVHELASEELQREACRQQLSVYCGFDPTADSLHLGNLLGLIVLAWFQRCGHQPVVLLGGATGSVGDPSGRSSERPALGEQEVRANAEAIGAQLDRILSRSCANHPAVQPGSISNGQPLGSKVKVVNNLDWFGSMSFLTFLGRIGKHARVGAMLAKDSVRARMESDQGISFTEFTYQLLQAYDFVHLCKEHGVRVQVGGSDQWGNITAGTDLIRRLLGRGEGQREGRHNGEDKENGSEGQAPQCFGLTFPLLVDSEGRKFGKSVGGAVWLSAEKLSPYKFYQHLFSVPDADVIKFLKMLTFLPLEQISALEAAMRSPAYAPNTAQRLLATEVTRFVHGEEGLQQALRVTEALKPGSNAQLDAATLEAMAGDAPSATLPRQKVSGVPLADVMVAVGLMPSKGQGRRLIKGGGVYLNNKKVVDELAAIQAADLIDGRMLLLATGKKNKMLIKVED